MTVPIYVPYLVVGAGVHGLSVAWHLALELKARNRGRPDDILVVDKTGVGAGASGIACGVVRNFYYQPAMTEIMRICVQVWESDPGAFGYHGCGYIAAVPAVQAGDCEAIWKRQQEIGYRSELYLGERACQRHMDEIFPDFRCDGLEAVLHERQGGFAVARRAVEGLAQKVREQGVPIVTGVAITGFDIRNGRVYAVHTNQGDIRCDVVVLGVGPWIGRFWEMLGLPNTIDIRTPDGQLFPNVPMWTYWKLQEGEVHTGEPYLDRHGRTPPVIHLDHVAPLVSDMTGRKISDGPWGIYWKQDPRGVQGGAVPIRLGHTCELEPYGHSNPDHVVGEEFADYYTAGLAWAMERFKGKSRSYHQRPNGGIGCFTPDNFPIFDWALPNVYAIADSNHGFKMIGVGKEVAAFLMDGRRASLDPFRLARYAEGDLHPTSHSPYPWN